MTHLGYARERLRSFLEEIERLTEVEFPHDHSKAALAELRTLFQQKLSRLDSFSSRHDPSIVMQECRLALRSMFDYLPLLGFILRSTNVRNGFEAFWPLLRMASLLLPRPDHSGTQVRLLLSSEWDYSPFTYPDIPDLPDFVFIGLPAPESANPLLIPLAGHELGHTVWISSDLEDAFLPEAKKEVVAEITNRFDEFKVLFQILIDPKDLPTDIVAVQTWGPAVRLCLLQAEESFCDCLGLRLFGPSFLHAMAFLLSPGHGQRSVRYPRTETRVANLRTAAAKYGIHFPDAYEALFLPEANPPLSHADDFFVSIADAALARVFPLLVQRADDIVRETPLPPQSDAEVQRIYDRFRRLVPAEDTKCLADVLNAGWVAYGAKDLWQDTPQLLPRRNSILKDLILKNLELLEIELRTQPSSGSST